MSGVPALFYWGFLALLSVAMVTSYYIGVRAGYTRALELWREYYGE